jgi:fumarate hydratase subunit beta
MTRSLSLDQSNLTSVVLQTPISQADVAHFRIGDVVSISGILYTARDKAHDRMLADPNRPFGLQNACIYHCGPLIVRRGETFRVLSAGPTTSARMNSQTPAIVNEGVTAIIGKGGMSPDVARSFVGRCFYLAFTGGCGVLAREKIVRVLDVYYVDLGVTEAVWKLKVVNFGPLLVAIDSHGDSIYEAVRANSRERLLRMTTQRESTQ